MRWIVKDLTGDVAPIHFEAVDDVEAMARWMDLMGLAEGDPDVDLEATPMCRCAPGCDCK